MNDNKSVLDPCCGSRMFYFDKKSNDVLYADIRAERHILCDGRKLIISPDMVMDFRSMPFEDCSFSLVVFDPPHMRRAGPESWQRKKYGCLTDSWREDLSKGFSECWRVLNTNGTLIFKWCETHISVREVLSCFSERPLFGQVTTKNLKTHWLVFFKAHAGGEEGKT